MSSTDAAWDAFVDTNPRASYLQLSGWARSKAANGWRPWAVEAGAEAEAEAKDESGDGQAAADRVGARILLRRPSGLPWTFAYAPRGPIAADWSLASLAAFTDQARSSARAGPVRGERISHLRVDPDIELDGPDDRDGAARRAFAELGWRRAPGIQPAATRVVDLGPPEDVLWGELRGKWRQYVNRARAGGIRVEDRGREALPEFHAILAETSVRAGSPIRTEASYRAIWDAFAPAGRTRLLFALDAAGTPQAALFLVRAGGRVVEPYGGMTAAGASSRANYLLKWEAIRTSREAGAASYDMWGLVHPGIRQFKEGFGGREVHLIGAFDLDLRRFGPRLYRLAEQRRSPRQGASEG